MPSSLEENYAAGSFGLRLAPGARPALLVVDFVRAYLDAGSPLNANAEPARAAAVKLLAAARAAVIPIVHTNVAYEAGGRNGGVFFRKVPALSCFEAGANPSSGGLRRVSNPRLERQSSRNNMPVHFLQRRWPRR